VNLVDELHAVTAALEEAGIPYAVCGGLAVTLHGSPRMTKDIDLLVESSDVTRILELLRPLGYVFAALPLTFEAGSARERHVQRVSKIADGEHLCVDLLLAEGVFAGLLADSLQVRLPNGPMRVISRAGLIKMKQLAGRPQDLADLAQLEPGDGDG
jgi:hypothetical protein